MKSINPPAIVRNQETDAQIVQHCKAAIEQADKSSWEVADDYLKLKQRGWTGRRIAKEFGVSESSVSKFMTCAKKFSLGKTRPSFWDAYQEVNSTIPRTPEPQVEEDDPAPTPGLQPSRNIPTPTPELEEEQEHPIMPTGYLTDEPDVKIDRLTGEPVERGLGENQQLWFRYCIRCGMKRQYVIRDGKRECEGCGDMPATRKKLSADSGWRMMKIDAALNSLAYWCKEYEYLTELADLWEALRERIETERKALEQATEMAITE